MVDTAGEHWFGDARWQSIKGTTKAIWDNPYFQAALFVGSFFIPGGAVGRAVGFVGRAFRNVFGGLGRWVGKGLGAVGRGLGSAAKAIGNGAKAIWNGTGGKWNPLNYAPDMSKLYIGIPHFKYVPPKGYVPGEYLSRLAPDRIQPGIRYLFGQYVNKNGKVKQWIAVYDDFGHNIARNDYNAGNRKEGIADVHYHLYEWKRGMDHHSYADHVPGEWFPGM